MAASIFLQSISNGVPSRTRTCNTDLGASPKRPILFTQINKEKQVKSRVLAYLIIKILLNKKHPF